MQAQAAPPPLRFTDAQKAEIVAQIKDKLVDGQSAQWRWADRAPGKDWYCGFVNAKNSFGGYTGFRPYVILYGINDTGKAGVVVFHLANDNPRSRDSLTVVNLCPANGYSLSNVPPE